MDGFWDMLKNSNLNVGHPPKMSKRAKRRMIREWGKVLGPRIIRIISNKLELEIIGEELLIAGHLRDGTYEDWKEGSLFNMFSFKGFNNGIIIHDEARRWMDSRQ